MSHSSQKPRLTAGKCVGGGGGGGVGGGVGCYPDVIVFLCGDPKVLSTHLKTGESV